MRPWRALLTVDPATVRLLVTDSRQNELLKARLPAASDHPRALLTLLEGLSLYSGAAMTAALSVEAALDRRCAEALFGSPLLPPDSALVRWMVHDAPRRRRTIAGLGDFRQLRLALRRSA